MTVHWQTPGGISGYRVLSSRVFTGAAMITLMFLSLACTGSNAPASSDSGDEITVEPPPEFPEYSGAGDCPTFEAGVNSGFDSAGQNRKFHLVLPEEPEGAP